MARRGPELEVEIQGQWPIAMQWYRNGELVPGEINRQLTIDPLTEANIGIYELRTSNALGDAVSEPALVALESISQITYASWAAGLGLAADSHFEDRDGNGHSNILEYALGESPTGGWPRFDRSTDGGGTRIHLHTPTGSRGHRVGTAVVRRFADVGIDPVRGLGGGARRRRHQQRTSSLASAELGDPICAV